MIHRESKCIPPTGVGSVEKGKGRQHPDFPGGHPPEYYPSLRLLNFAERTGYGAFSLRWPSTLGIGSRPESYPTHTHLVRPYFDHISTIFRPYFDHISTIFRRLHMQMGDHRVPKRVTDPAVAAWVSGWVRFVFDTPRTRIQTTKTPCIKVHGRPEPPMAYPGQVKGATKAYPIV